MKSLIQLIAEKTGSDEKLVEMVIDRFIFHLEQRLPQLIPDLIAHILEGCDFTELQASLPPADLVPDLQEDEIPF